MASKKIPIPRVVMFYLIAAGFAISLGYTNCGQIALQKKLGPIQTLSSKGDFCLIPEVKNQVSKFVFIGDKSGSNASTDPSNLRRAGNMEAFVNKHFNDQDTEYALISFQGSGAQVRTIDAFGRNGFSDPAGFLTALEGFKKDQDNDSTPYIAGINEAKLLINADIDANDGKDITYNVIFLSDGVPTDPGPNVTNDPADRYLLAVKELRSKKPESIFFSTGFYTPGVGDTELVAMGLRYMAEIAGGGKYKNFENNDELDFDTLLGGRIFRPHLMKGPRLVVRNLNAGFCNDATIDVDSDADGLCDKDEKELSVSLAAQLKGKSFKPDDRNSLNPYYSDSFVYRFQILNKEVLPVCLNKKDSDFDLLTDCEEALLKDQKANGPTVYWTTMMGSKYANASSKSNPDSDGDTFIDSLEFFQFGIRSASVNFLNTRDQYPGGLSGEQLMSEHRHPMKPESFNRYNYDPVTRFVKRDPSTGYNCYFFDQKQLALYETLPVSKSETDIDKRLAHGRNENAIYSYYLSNPEDDPNGLGVLHHSIQMRPFTPEGGIPGLSFENFEEYLIPLEP